MPSVQLDAQAADQLRAATGPVDVVDQEGRMIGRFSPVPAGEPLFPGDPTFTLEDADRIYQEGGGTTIEEFWKQMGVR